MALFAMCRLCYLDTAVSCPVRMSSPSTYVCTSNLELELCSYIAGRELQSSSILYKKFIILKPHNKYPHIAKSGCVRP